MCIPYWSTYVLLPLGHEMLLGHFLLEVFRILPVIAPLSSKVYLLLPLITVSDLINQHTY